MEKRRSPPSSRAQCSSTGSRSFWLHRHHPAGLNRASPPPGSISLNSHSWSSPVSDPACRMPWLSARTEAASRISCSTPAVRNSSIVRTLLPRPRGWRGGVGVLLDQHVRMPSRPRKSEADRPTREPPTMRTGTRSSASRIHRRAPARAVRTEGARTRWSVHARPGAASIMVHPHGSEKSRAPRVYDHDRSGTALVRSGAGRPTTAGQSLGLHRPLTTPPKVPPRPEGDA